MGMVTTRSLGRALAYFRVELFRHFSIVCRLERFLTLYKLDLVFAKSTLAQAYVAGGEECVSKLVQILQCGFANHVTERMSLGHRRHIVRLEFCHFAAKATFDLSKAV